MPRNSSTQLVGIAGVHHVVSELSRRGLIALPTVRNIAAYDVVVTTPDGQRHANLQVKTSLMRVGFFPAPSADRIRAARHDWYVLVRWLDKEQRFEGFMLSGKQAKAEVMRDRLSQTARMKTGHKAFFPAIPVSGPRVGRRPDAWRKKWLNWTL
jgi:hypothetical protein